MARDVEMHDMAGSPSATDLGDPDRDDRPSEPMAAAPSATTAARATAVVVRPNIMPPGAAVRQSRGRHQHRRRRYRGGFATSICGLFDDPTRRSDCCALACCGVLLHDRTRYLLKKERPPHWTRRVCRNVILPAVLFLCIPVVVAVVVAGGGDEDAASSIGFFLFVGWIVLCVVLFGMARWGRMKTRREILSRLYREERGERGRGEGDADADDVLDDGGDDAGGGRLTYVRRQEFDTRRANRLCACFPDDSVFVPADDVGVIAADDAIDDGGDGTELLLPSTSRSDLCSCLWAVARAACCGTCCNCWVQCCGCCAAGQEGREVDRWVTDEERSIDYVTFQPFAEYHPALEELRANKNRNLFAHYRHLSKLSIKLLKLLHAFVAFCLVVSLTNIDQTFTFENALVLLATFCQAFIILYLVHWKWHRFDLSLDAVVKYFACGFLVVMGLALVFEILIQIPLNVAFFFVVILLAAGDGTMAALASEGTSDEYKTQVMIDWVRGHVGLFVFLLFLNSFVVAALVEELGKYFGYWMVEHPDLLTATEVEAGGDEERERTLPEGASSSSSPAGDDAGAELEPVTAAEGGGGARRGKSLNSSGAGVTIAMVSVALGFACCENLVYIFLYTPPTLESEISTLLARSLFPVHPLCAAIQSIGVCRRDIEGDTSCRLGRCILPAVMLHGSYDFALMTMAFFGALPTLEDKFRRSGGDDDASPAGGEGSGSEESATTVDDLIEEIPALLVGMSFVVLGVVYYVVASRSQKRRLDALEVSRASESAFDSDALLV